MSGARPRVRITGEEVLSDGWSTLRRISFDYERFDGDVVQVAREVYDRRNGATILLFDPARRTVLLTRQFRLPAFVNGHPDGMLLETAAGLLDGDDPATAIRREAEEETGVRTGEPTPLFDLYMSPGSVTERLAFFVAEYSEADRVDEGGGVGHEGEDIEVVELELERALAMVDAGEIRDGKTVLLLLWAQRHYPPAP